MAMAQRRPGEHQVRAARSDQQGQCGTAADRLAAAGVDGSLVKRKPDFSFSRDFRATPLMIDGTLYSPNGIGLVEAFHPATGKTLWVQQPFADEPQQGLLGDSTRTVCLLGGREPAAALRHPRRISHRARPAHRPADHDVGRERPGEPEARPRTESDHLPGVKRTTGVWRRRDDRRQHDRPAASQGAAAGERSGVRRALGQASLDVSRRSAPGRIRDRNLGKRFLGVHRQHQPVVDDQRRRGGRARLFSAHEPDQRHVRRASAGRQPVQRLPGLRQVRHRRARLALPDRPSRSVGLRPALRSDSRRHHRGRKADEGRRAADQAGVCVRVRSSDRSAGVADRGAPRAGVRHAGRAHVADAAVSDQAAALRSAGRLDRRSDRLHARSSARKRSSSSSNTGSVRCSRRRRCAAMVPTV